MIEIGVNPVAFLNVRWYGILVALAVAVLVIWIAWHVHKDKRISVDTVMVAALVGIPSGIVVSRAIHVIDLWDYYSQNPGEIVSGMGLTIWGAILGGVLGIWITSRFTKFKFGYFADVLAPGLILAQIIGRIGCTINGCCYGEESELPWAIIYTHPETFGPTSIAVHPTTVYEIIFLAISFGIIMFLRGRLKPEGSLFFTYLGMYSGWRIAIGFMRDGTDFLFGLHQAQIIGIIVLLIIIPIMIAKTRWGKPEVELPEKDVPIGVLPSDDILEISGNDTGDEIETDENEVKND
ncbi:MAG: prolipoprotein diacylglyceryl transferase [Dehalococcoidales bacterium]|nr:MAG: prolipoprotein diacylglyceryl transferase [Dehalococcoidales bacterium]